MNKINFIEGTKVHYTETKHPVLHLCQRCASPLKVFALAGAMNIFWEFVSFLPTHEFFHWMGWL